MIKRISLIMVMLILFSSMLSCNLIKKVKSNNAGNNSQQEQNSEEQPKDNEPPSSDVKPQPEPEPIDPIKEQIDMMTLDEKIGQMLIVGIDGYDVNDNTKSLLQKYKVGGFIIMGNNVQDTPQLLTLLNSLKMENKNNKIPLFLSVDEEGGKVSRMPEEFSKFPTNKTIGRINNKVFSYEIGSTIADEIGSFGFNIDFAPVLDINSNPKNPVIGNRAFGSTIDLVSSLGVETMKGIQSQSVIPVVKHFPGHGDTSVDSHKGLPVVNNDLQRLQSFEFIPFAEAIKAGADMVMVAHILLPNIDKENPSSMSKVIITDILRGNLGFSGVVITDDMTMGAITKNYNIGEAAVKSVLAGSDIVLVCHGYDNEVQVINTIKEAVSSGKISEDRINESVYRIIKLKEKYNINDNTIESVDVDEINNRINTLLKKYYK